MQINALFPIVGLVLIIGNLVLGVIEPSAPPTAMGVQLFIGGMTTIIIAVVSLIDPINVGPFERTLLFVGGCINCSVGYYMVLLEIQKRSP